MLAKSRGPLALLALAMLAMPVVRARPFAPQQKPQVPTFRTGVDVSQITVRVIDEKRQPIRGLTERDFTVLLNGKPQPIVTVVEQEESGPIEPSAPWMRDIASDVATNELRDPRLIVIVMDDGVPVAPARAGPLPKADVKGKATPYQMEQARAVARGLIDQLGPNDLASVCFSADNRGPQDFTGDRAKLLAAIESYHPTEMDVLLYGEYVRNTARNALEFLRQTPERRSAIFWISDVMPPSDEDVLPLTVRPVPPTSRVAATLQAGATTVPFYFVSIVGFTGGPPPRWNGEWPMGKQTLASKTGGRIIAQTNTPAVEVPSLFRELNVAYTIGFQQAEPDPEGRFRRIQVRVNRPNVLILPQDSGYFPAKPKAVKAAAAAAESAVPTTLALSGLVPLPDEPLRLVLAPFARTDERTEPLALVAVALGLDVPFSTRLGESVDIEFRVFDAEGRVQVEERRLTQALRPRGNRDRGEFDILTTLMLEPGRYNVRAAVFSQGRQSAGSVYADVTVPDLMTDELTLSGAVVSVPLGKPALPATEFGAWLPVVPSTTRTFTPSDVASVFLRVYTRAGAAETAVSVVAEVRDTSDAVVATQAQTVTPKSIGALKSADYAFTLPLERLKPGEYLLTITAKAGAGAVQQRHVRFAVKGQ